MDRKKLIKLGIIIGIPIAIICLIVCFCFLIYSLSIIKINLSSFFDPNRNNYDKSIYVLTKYETKDVIKYYEINNYGYKRGVDKFNYNNNEILYLNNCFDSYIDNNKVLNKRRNECRILDDNNNEIIIDERYDDIINNVSNLEHSIMGSKIIKTNNNIYVVVADNVNFWSPYKLYKYDNNKLNHIYTFDGEDVIGIKEK